MTADIPRPFRISLLKKKLGGDLFLEGTATAVFFI
jgi:hypothetical protein